MGAGKGPTSFARLLLELGLRDVWRLRHQGVKCYSCHLATHGELFRIDLGLGNDLMLPLVSSSKCEARTVSDHSPLCIQIITSGIVKRTYWKINPFWLSLFPSPNPIHDSLATFIKLNKSSTAPGIFWDTLKAFLRGQFIKSINTTKTRTSSWEQSVLREVERAESAFVDSPSEQTERAWGEAQHIAEHMVLTKSENKRFFLQQKFFEEGGKVQVICLQYWRDR